MKSAREGRRRNGEGRRLYALSAVLVSMLTAVAAEPRVQWQPLESGVTVRLRGVSAVSPRVAWASGEKGTVLRTTDGGATWQQRSVPGAEDLDFRDVDARSDRVASLLSIGPGTASRIYRTMDGGATWTLQFTNDDPRVFLDAMAFTDDAHGVAFSDAVDDRFVMFMTDDGGAHWTRVPAERLPPALPGEGAFAASGTNVVVRGPHIWIGTTASRVLHSDDGGRSWAIARTPLDTGQATGIFSIAFRDDRHGVIVGGNYTRETDAVNNVATSSDGGATWQAAAGVSGYRSVVAWMPGLGPAGWLAVGPSGADVSFDDGRTWAPAGGEGYDALSVAPGGNVGYAAGSRGRIARVTLR